MTPPDSYTITNLSVVNELEVDLDNEAIQPSSGLDEKHPPYQDKPASPPDSSHHLLLNMFKSGMVFAFSLRLLFIVVIILNAVVFYRFLATVSQQESELEEWERYYYKKSLNASLAVDASIRNTSFQISDSLKNANIYKHFQSKVSSKGEEQTDYTELYQSIKHCRE